MKPAEAARAPDGDTKIATGVLSAIMLDTIARVESTSPPGVRSVNTTRTAPATIGTIERVDHVFRGDGVDDAVNDGGIDDRTAGNFVWRGRNLEGAGARRATRHRQDQREISRQPPRAANSHGGQR